MSVVVDNEDMNPITKIRASFRPPNAKGRIIILSLLAASLMAAATALWSGDAAAHHPNPTDAYAVTTDDTGNPGQGGTRDFSAKKWESCSYNNHHSGKDEAGNARNGHLAVELLNATHGTEGDYKLYDRLPNGGIVVTPIFNCLPNFWGWIIYRDENGQKVFVDDVEDTSANPRAVQSPWGYEQHGGSKFYAARPQHERATHSNTVTFPDSEELMSGVGYGGGIGVDTPMLYPSGEDSNDRHIVFKYYSGWYNGDTRASAHSGLLTSAKDQSVKPDEPIWLKIWTAESIEQKPAHDPTSVNPFGPPGNLSYGNPRVWPYSSDPASRHGFVVGRHVSDSIWDRVIRSMSFMYQLGRIVGPTGATGLNMACQTWGIAANVASDGCESPVQIINYGLKDSDHLLQYGSEDAPPKSKLDDDGREARWRGFEGVEPEREVYFTRRMSLGEPQDSVGPSSGTIVASLRDRGYPVQVAGPPMQATSTPAWPAGMPLIKDFEIVNGPAAIEQRYVGGETLKIRLTFSEPVAFIDWRPQCDVTQASCRLMQEAASYQTLFDLRLRLVGLSGCGGAPGSYERRSCESAIFDTESGGVDERGRRVWSFRYLIPDGVYTDTDRYLGIAATSGQYLDSTGAYTTPFWFAHDSWRSTNPGDSLDGYFQVGTNFAGLDRPLTANDEIDRDIRIDDVGDLRTYRVPDLHIDTPFAFGGYNTIANVDVDDLRTARQYARHLLSFDGLLKGTPAAVTYERGYVVLGWTVMMNLVFALFVLFIAWAAITSIVKPMISSQDSGSGWKEMAPRIILAAVAAASSFWWCRLLIDLADAVTRYVAEALRVSPGDILHVGSAVQHVLLSGYSSVPGAVASDSLTGVAGAAGGTALINVGSPIIMLGLVLVMLFYLVLGLLILGQLILRIVMINILMIVSPVAMSMFILPDTAAWGRRWLSLWMITLMTHAIQLVGLGLALSFVRSTIPLEDEVITAMQVFWALLLGCFALYVTWKLPSMMGDGGIAEGFLTTMTMVTNMMAHLPQAVRTGTTLAAAGATGGVGAVALTAFGASPSALSSLGMMKNPVPPSGGGGQRP